MKPLDFGQSLTQLDLPTYWDRTQHLWKAAAELLEVGVAPNNNEKALASLRAALDAYGVKWFSAEEITLVHHPEKAIQYAEQYVTRENGVRFFLPVYMWLVYGVLFTVADKMRHAANSPVTVRNVFRPRPYNVHVTSAAFSDHVWGVAGDFDFASWLARRRASAVLKPLQDCGLLRMSVGTGGNTIHLGMFAPQTLLSGVARRDWTYGKV
jgi:hypothetical protein